MPVPGLLRRGRRVPRRYCAPCAGFHVLPGGYVFGRGTACTCGAGPVDELTLHTVDCDTVPCPFCQLLNESL
jgi:hypothetical protein